MEALVGPWGVLKKERVMTKTPYLHIMVPGDTSEGDDTEVVLSVRALPETKKVEIAIIGYYGDARVYLNDSFVHVLLDSIKKVSKEALREEDEYYAKEAARIERV
jgi:hypothetical protein